MSRSLFILKLREDYSQDPSYSKSYQIATGMYNSAKFVVDELNAGGQEAKMVVVVDNNAIDKAVTEYQPTHVFIEGLWVVPSKFPELMAIGRHKDVKWIVRVHSEIPFLQSEGIAMEWIAEYLRQGVYVAPNAPRAHEQLKWLAQSMVSEAEADRLVPYLPNCFPVDFSEYPIKTKVADPEFIDIACFGAYRPLKNHLQQAFVALRYAESIGKKLRFHTNGRIDSAGQQPSKNVDQLIKAVPGAELIVHDWEDRETFLQSLQDIDLLLQVSISETFNIVGADAVLVGTPMLVSKEISWAYPTYGDPQSVADCLRKLQLIMSNKSFFINGNRTGLTIYASASRRRWLSYLGA